MTLTDRQINKIRTLRNQGASILTIRRKTKHSPVTILKYLNSTQTTDSFPQENNSRSKPSPVSTPIADTTPHNEIPSMPSVQELSKRGKNTVRAPISLPSDENTSEDEITVRPPVNQE